MTTGFSWGRQTGKLLAILLVITAIVFFPVVHTSFINLDDGAYAAYNPHVQGGLTWDNFCWAWEPHNIVGFWIPLTWISLEIDGSLTPVKPQAAPEQGRLMLAPPPLPDATVFKIHNLVLHLGVTGLVFLSLFRMTGRKWAAFVVALVWAVHPLRVESVAWVTERKDVLASFFGFLAIYFYAVWAEKRRAGWYVGVCAAFAMSLLAKATFVTLPFLLLVLDFWPLGRVWNWREFGRRGLEKIPLLILAVGISYMSVRTQLETHSVAGFYAMPVWLRFEHAAVTYVAYLRQQFEPWNLAIFYPYDYAPKIAEVAVGFAVVAGVTGLGIWQRRRQPWLLVGWLWFLGTLVPVIGFLQVGDQGQADRFTYLPAVGFLVMVVFGAERFVRRMRRGKVLARVAVALVTAGLGAMTVWQIGYWKSDVMLYEHAVEVTPANFNIHMMASASYLREGNVEKAEESYRRALELNPKLEPGWYSLGLLDLEIGQYELAEKELGIATMMQPRDPRLRFYYGQALYCLHRDEEAIEQYQVSLRINPNDEQVKRNLQKLMEERKGNGVLAPR